MFISKHQVYIFPLMISILQNVNVIFLVWFELIYEHKDVPLLTGSALNFSFNRTNLQMFYYIWE